MLFPRPDTQTLVEAVKIEVEAAIAELSPHARITRALERVLYSVLSRAIDQGVSLQRDVVLQAVAPTESPPPPLPPEEEITRRIRRP